MEKTSMEKILAIKSRLKQIYNWEGKSLEQIRGDEVSRTSKLIAHPGIIIEKVTIGSFTAEWIKADNVPPEKESVILYFHGGGFVSGSCDTHRDLAAGISKASRVRVLLIEYRLAPEHKYPAANDDCLFAYRWLIKNGISSENIIMGGDSAGGGLTLMTLLSLRDAGDPLPAVAFVLSPFGEMINFDGESYISRAELDPLVSLQTSKMCMEYYLDSPLIKPAILAPINLNLHGLPSLFIQVGDHEVLLNDSTRLAERARKAGVDVTLEVWDNMWHVFQLFTAILPEAEQAIINIGKFVQNHLG